MKDKLSALINEVNGYRRKRERLIGSIRQLKKSLKEDFSCSTLKEAKTLLGKLRNEKSKLEDLLDKGIKKVERQLAEAKRTEKRG